MKNLKSFFEETDLSYLEKVTEFKYNHKEIWEKAYLPSQIKKSKSFNLSEVESEKAYNTLINRGRLLRDLFSYFDFKNFCEVGTAEGYQHFIIADYLKSENIQGVSYSCDIRDVRNSQLKDKYNNCSFVLGDSKELSNQIREDGNSIDMFWIDGDHRNSAVLKDLIRLSKNQSDNCIWVFDDFDARFGSFNELMFIASLSESIKIKMGITASNNDNHILIVQGTF